MSAIEAIARADPMMSEALDLLRREVRVGPRFPDMTRNPHYFGQYVFLPNGWIVSVGYGSGHDCSNRGSWWPFSEEQALESHDCEVAIFRPDGSWFAPHADANPEEDEAMVQALRRMVAELGEEIDASDLKPPTMRQAWGNVSAGDFLRVVDAVATYQDGGPCACPDCVRGT